MTSFSAENLKSPQSQQSLSLENQGFKPGQTRSLRIAIVTENFLPKIDGVTRTLAMLLEHLESEGHTALVLGPESGLTSYAGHEVIGTKGIPLLGIYNGLKLNFIRPKFIRRLMEFKPDVIQFVDPIWLCAQCIPAIQYFLPNVPLLASYHTNLSVYAELYGFAFLTSTMWDIQRNLHGRCSLTFCPSPSTARMLQGQGFENVRLWPRGVNTALFRPTARDMNLRNAWKVEAPTYSETGQIIPVSTAADFSFNISPNLVASGKIVLLYVGRISWEKNLRLLVEACRGLEKPSEDGTRPACQLVFVGDGPSRPELEVLCASYGMDAIFMGYRKGTELAAAYASADIFAFPSWTETFGQVVLESLGSGLPVVGLRAEGVCDLVKDQETGLLLDMDDLLPSGTPLPPLDASGFKPLPENPHLLLDTKSSSFPTAVTKYQALLVDLATNTQKRKALGKAAAIDAAKRSWHEAMEMIVTGYRELAKPLVSNSSLTLSRASSLTLSRTPTLEIDIVSHTPSSEEAQSTSASPRIKRDRVHRVLKLVRRSGGRIRDQSMSTATWISGRQGGNLVLMEPKKLVGWTTGLVIKLVVLSYLFYMAFLYSAGTIRSAMGILA